MRYASRLPIALTAAILLGSLTAGSLLAAEPTTEVIDLNDPALDAEESAWASDLCGFPIEADVAGRIEVIDLDDGSAAMLQVNVYGIRATYRNPETGVTLRLRDVGPDRIYVRDGRVFIGVTGRSTSSNVIGLVVVDLGTGEIVHESGTTWDFWGQFCSLLGA